MFPLHSLKFRTAAFALVQLQAAIPSYVELSAKSLSYNC
jgi:hypothetical protein